MSKKKTSKKPEVIKGPQEHDSAKILKTIKIAIAVMMDSIDLLFANIPGINTLWDFVTATVLYFMLDNKKLAFFSLTETLIPGLPFFGQIDAVIPLATILTIIDNKGEKFKRRFRHEKTLKMRKIN
ncbi:MAG: hypothetical protein ACLFPQ_04835 [Candidatus Woesearchaeota archaeon]